MSIISCLPVSRSAGECTGRLSDKAMHRHILTGTRRTKIPARPAPCFSWIRKYNNFIAPQNIILIYMKRILTLFLLLMVGAVLVAGCTSSNQDEELRSTMYESGQAMSVVLENAGCDASNLDYAGIIQSGRALKTESNIWYDKISAINDISPEWQSVKSNYLKALRYFGDAGEELSQSGQAFQRGDFTASLAYINDASADLDSGSRYMDEAVGAIPK